MTTDGWIFVLGSVGGFCTTFAYCAAGDQDLEAGWPGFVLRDAGALFVWGAVVAGVWVAIARAGGGRYESCDRYIDCDRYGVKGVDGSEGGDQTGFERGGDGGELKRSPLPVRRGWRRPAPSERKSTAGRTPPGVALVKAAALPHPYQFEPWNISRSSLRPARRSEFRLGLLASSERFDWPRMRGSRAAWAGLATGAGL
jgi:hypothetical protein